MFTSQNPTIVIWVLWPHNDVIQLPCFLAIVGLEPAGRHSSRRAFSGQNVRMPTVQLAPSHSSSRSSAPSSSLFSGSQTASRDV
ncbi:uncharacterized [Tachysurus ichikawai]